MKEFSYITREKDIEQANGGFFDVLIIGGGITGSGVANILSKNGISAILVEKSDFGSGTSQGSSKLIHGGLRYLQEREFRRIFTSVFMEFRELQFSSKEVVEK